MRHHARFCALVFAALVIAISADFNHVLAQTATPTPVLPGQVIISELRLRGPAGSTDEFIELYNNTDSPIVVQASDTSPGWGVFIANNQINAALFVVPNGITIPARGHYLGAHATGYSLCNYPSGSSPGGPIFTAHAAAAAVAAPCVTNGVVPGSFTHTTPNQTWEIDVPDGVGVALFTTTSVAAQSPATRLDAFGFTGSPALFREGAGFPTVVTLNTEHTYYRDLRGTTPRDTEDNATDFLLVSTSGGAPGIQSIPLLGAPGPENLNSPVQMNSGFTTTLIDPSVAASQPPNRSRDFTPEPADNSDFGTLFIRRTIRNDTGLPVIRLRFRVIIITTLGSPSSDCGGSGICADLRARFSQDDEVSVDNQLVEVRGLRLEEPPEQGAGGAYNSSLSADFVNLETRMLPGESINVVFRLGVMRTGPFRFFVNVEAQTGTPVSVDGPAPSGAAGNTTTGLKQRRTMMETRQAAPAADVPAPAANAPAPSPSAAPQPPRTVYVPLFVNTRPAAPTPARDAKDEADDDEGEEKESKDAPPSARPAPQTPAAAAPDSSAPAADDPAPASDKRAPSKKAPAAGKAPRRGQQ